MGLSRTVITHSFMMMSFALIIILRDGKPSSSVIFASCNVSCLFWVLVGQRSDSKDRFRVRRIRLRDMCLRFLEESITFQLFWHCVLNCSHTFQTFEIGHKIHQKKKKKKEGKKKGKKKKKKKEIRATTLSIGRFDIKSSLIKLKDFRHLPSRPRP